MNLWWGYIVVSKKLIQLNSTWRDAVALFKGSLGKAETDPSPAKRLHWRESLDSKQVIFEGTLNLDVLDTEVKAVNSQVFARGRSWEESRQAASDYIDANLENWKEAID